MHVIRVSHRAIPGGSLRCMRGGADVSAGGAESRDWLELQLKSACRELTCHHRCLDIN